MKQYLVKIRDTKIKELVQANSELEAMYIFCKKKELNYRVYGNKLEVKESK
jgi:hypothetical protein